MVKPPDNAIKPGDIVQIDPAKPMCGGCLLVVTEIKSFGVQGYTQSAGVDGQAYWRPSWEDIEPTGGRAVWVEGDNP